MGWRRVWIGYKRILDANLDYVLLIFPEALIFHLPTSTTKGRIVWLNETVQSALNKEYMLMHFPENMKSDTYFNH